MSSNEIADDRVTLDRGLGDHLEKYLTFLVDDEIYGLEILKVREIVAMLHISKVPLVPDYVKGVINLRGKVIPVIDIRLKFKMEDINYDEHTTIIIVDVDDISVGFIVDETSEVVKIKQENLMPPPKFGTGIDTSFLKSMAKTEANITMIVDLEKLFSSDEIKSLSIHNKEEEE
ncbi:MAG: purine-binding chemotaxis protein CheW [Arcobacteraceae bacterium]|nr:purine-binding chemotaxis protein CheW [Arcobacteraceae bacterium]